jgi:hypothetical protein
MKTSPILLMILWMITACSAPKQQPDTQATAPQAAPSDERPVAAAEGHFIHNVFFWLKADMTPEQTRVFETSLATLGEIGTVQQMVIGTPAGTPRQVVDNTYDYALIVHFEDASGHDAYQTDQIHLDFLDACERYIDRVQIYDVRH